MKKQFENTVIEVFQGDITDFSTDAIVNAANNHLWMGSGVAGAIKRKGGIEIEKEAVSKGPIPVGEAAATGAGKLPAKYVIHAAAMGQDLVTDADKIAEATKNSLLRAEELGLESIAFPALGTGVGGFSISEAAGIMLKETVNKIKSGTVLKRVVFVLFDEAAAHHFEKVLEEM